VLLEVRIAIPIQPDTLPPELRAHADQVKKALGDEIIFSHKNERNFIAATEAPKILKDMQERFLARRPLTSGILILPPGSSGENSRQSKPCCAGSV
jgi:hypothetical protein